MGGGSYIYFIIPSWSSNIFRYPWRSGEKGNSEYSWAVIHIYLIIPSKSSNIFRYPRRGGEKGNPEYSWAVVEAVGKSSRQQFTGNDKLRRRIRLSSVFFYHLCFSVSDKICQTKLSKGEFDTWRLCLSLRLRGVSYVLGQFQNWPRNFGIS